ncbi:MAG: sodium:proton antiporter [Planctomycetes bacterium]|nr:sodium:proton antiporter [Planctomycetota bacterium]MCB9911457.1 sodium:proton antiporter [Planctomycetota bacterium]
MTIFQIIAVLISMTAIFSYFNFRYFKLPATIGVMLISLLMSLALIVVGQFLPWVHESATRLIQQVDFNDALMQGMLCFLLFAGALHIDLSELKDNKGVIATLAVAGVVLSMFAFGTMIYYVLGWLDLELSYVWCLLFGALISPTDPVAVIGILRESKVPRSLEVQIAGESLFNDGIGVVAFIVMREIAVSGDQASAAHIGQLFLKEAVGGAVFGFVIGWIAFRLLKSVNNYRIEVMLTLALVMGGYALASVIHVSGPIAIVVAGLFIGNHGRQYAMSDTTRNNVDAFWELIDEILNALLFVLIGLEMLVLAFTRNLMLAGLLAIPAILLARLVSVGLPVGVIRRTRELMPGTVRIMTWGGLRGGISVALALSLPASREREIVLAVTYVIVIFSILVQGLSLERFARAMIKR